MTSIVTEPTPVQTISPDQLKHLLDSGDAIEVIDVRTPMEYRGKRVSMARNVPLDKLNAESIKSDRSGKEAQPLYVVCHSGGRARKACEVLVAAGVNAICIEGGTPACEKVGVPVCSDRKALSLERQVRIAVGLLIVLGALLTATANPWFLLVPAFMGCGLIFAGLTDWCGIATVLAKMPWNN